MAFLLLLLFPFTITNPCSLLPAPFRSKGFSGGYTAIAGAE
jgi:hypothetical protein